MSLRASAHTGVAIPEGFRMLGGDCHVGLRPPRNDMRIFYLLLVLGIDHGLDLDGQAVEVDEALGVGLVVIGLAEGDQVLGIGFGIFQKR